MLHSGLQGPCKLRRHQTSLRTAICATRLTQYVVQGMVKDDQGLPVEGAALHVGKQVAYTDSSGRFMVRFSKRGPFPFSIAAEEFITNGVYAVVSAPTQVSADAEGRISDVQVVIRRVPSPQARLYKQ